MSPEQINGQRVDARADVFALGVLLYEYACGTHPFEGSTPLATVARVLESDAPPIANRCPELAGGVADVIGRCLRKAPDARYASAAAVLEALDGAVDARPVTAEHRTWWRVHQLVVSVLYIVAAALAWQIKAWDENPLTVSLFLALGAGATIGCVIRGHLLFTDHFNRAHLGGERRRTARPRLLLDLLFASILFVDAIVISRLRALPAVCALSLALGIALAGVLLEPATSAAAFGDEEDRPPC
jgi:hypothetical protein